jgi:hypothetical protein
MHTSTEVVGLIAIWIVNPRKHALYEY